MRPKDTVLTICLIDIVYSILLFCIQFRKQHFTRQMLESYHSNCLTAAHQRKTVAKILHSFGQSLELKCKNNGIDYSENVIIPEQANRVRTCEHNLNEKLYAMADFQSEKSQFAQICW